MRGGFLHNEVLARRLTSEAKRRGVGVEIEVPVRIAGAGGSVSTCFIDLLLTIKSYRVAVEVECSPRRVLGDLRKAQVIGADELWITVAHGRLVRSVRRALSRSRFRGALGSSYSNLFVLTQGQSLQRLGELCALISGANGASENNFRIGEQADQSS